MNIPEEFLHFLWKHKFLPANLQIDITQEPLLIQYLGSAHSGSGPDFQNARIRIGDTLWVGNIEIHVNSSDWIKHKHEEDPAYRNVILHVVWNNDIMVCYTNGKPIPTLALKDYISQELIQKYFSIYESKSTIPCQNQLTNIDTDKTRIWLSRLVAERLEYRWKQHCLILEQNKNNWNELLWLSMAQTFGRHINAIPFEWLLRQIPPSVQRTLNNKTFQVHILLLGLSGLIPVYASRVPVEWMNEAHYLIQKHSLSPVPIGSWKLKGFRPSGNPYNRIMQFASVLELRPVLLQLLLDTNDLKILKEQLRKTENSPPGMLNLGNDMLHALFINTLIPVLYSYGKYSENYNHCQKALSWLHILSSEKNSVTVFWEKMGFKSKSAEESQALKHLMDYYCTAKQCLKCHFAFQILKQKNT